MNINVLQCTQQDNTFLINGKSGKITVTPGTVLNATMRNTNASLSTCLGLNTPTWGVVSKSGPVNPPGTEVRVDSGTNIIDSNGCGSTSLVLNVEGTYLLVARWCCVWDPLQNYTHCAEPDADIPNAITVVVTSATPPPGGTTCDPTTCPPSANFCVAGNCIPKTIVLGGAVLLLLMMTMKN